MTIAEETAATRGYRAKGKGEGKRGKGDRRQYSNPLSPPLVSNLTGANYISLIQAFVYLLYRPCEGPLKPKRILRRY